MQTDFLPLEGTDYVEFYVGNAKQAAHYYMTAFGFQALAYSGPETGVKDKVSYALRQHKLTFVLTTPLRKDNPVADHIYKHGDGVKAITLRVNDAAGAWKETTQRGAKSYLEPTAIKDNDGEVVMSAQLFPDEKDNLIRLFSTDGAVLIDHLQYWPLKSAW